MKVEGVDNEITGNSLIARSREKRIDRAIILLVNELFTHLYRKSIICWSLEKNICGIYNWYRYNDLWGIYE